jgi:Fur family transcriptional regulator, ferric uptake regulator
MPTTSPTDLRAAVVNRLAAGGQRLTATRAAVVDALTDAARPLTIPELLAATPTLAQSSAYRILVVLEQAGVVHRLATNDDHTRYELAEDLTGHHHHLVCSRCGTVQDVPTSTKLERSLHAAAEEITRETGFRAHHHRFDLVGLCGRCA